MVVVEVVVVVMVVVDVVVDVVVVDTFSAGHTMDAVSSVRHSTYGM